MPLIPKLNVGAAECTRKTHLGGTSERTDYHRSNNMTYMCGSITPSKSKPRASTALAVSSYRAPSDYSVSCQSGHSFGPINTGRIYHLRHCRKLSRKDLSAAAGETHSTSAKERWQKTSVQLGNDPIAWCGTTLDSYRSSTATSHPPPLPAHDKKELYMSSWGIGSSCGPPADWRSTSSRDYNAKQSDQAGRSKPTLSSNHDNIDLGVGFPSREWTSDSRTSFGAVSRRRCQSAMELASERKANWGGSAFHGALPCIADPSAPTTTGRTTAADSYTDRSGESKPQTIRRSTAPDDVAFNEGFVEPMGLSSRVFGLTGAFMRPPEPIVYADHSNISFGDQTTRRWSTTAEEFKAPMGSDSQRAKAPVEPKSSTILRTGQATTEYNSSNRESALLATSALRATGGPVHQMRPVVSVGKQNQAPSNWTTTFRDEYPARRAVKAGSVVTTRPTRSVAWGTSNVQIGMGANSPDHYDTTSGNGCLAAGPIMAPKRAKARLSASLVAHPPETMASTSLSSFFYKPFRDTVDMKHKSFTTVDRLH